MDAPRNIVVLTGAGISAESGLSTFRDPQGVWARYRLEDLATPMAFAKDPAQVHAFYNMRRRETQAAAPNAAHKALAALQKRLAARGGTLTLVTQNVDDLHERAGADRVLHMHGELLKVRCEGLEILNQGDEGCGAVMGWREDLSVSDVCPACGAAGFLRPHIVWFHEMPLGLETIGAALDTADLFVSIGTSGAVWPAAGFVQEARGRGVATLELNLEPSEGGAYFDDARYGPATEVVPAWADGLAR